MSLQLIDVLKTSFHSYLLFTSLLSNQKHAVKCVANFRKMVPLEGRRKEDLIKLCRMDPVFTSEQDTVESFLQCMCQSIRQLCDASLVSAEYKEHVQSFGIYANDVEMATVALRKLLYVELAGENHSLYRGVCKENVDYESMIDRFLTGDASDGIEDLLPLVASNVFGVPLVIVPLYEEANIVTILPVSNIPVVRFPVFLLYHKSDVSHKYATFRKPQKDENLPEFKKQFTGLENSSLLITKKSLLDSESPSPNGLPVLDNIITLITEDPSPASENSTPACENSISISANAIPASESSDSVSENPSLISGNPTMTFENSTLTSEDPSPMLKKSPPVLKTAVPDLETLAEVVEASYCHCGSSDRKPKKRCKVLRCTCYKNKRDCCAQCKCKGCVNNKEIVPKDASDTPRRGKRPRPVSDHITLSTAFGCVLSKADINLTAAQHFLLESCMFYASNDETNNDNHPDHSIELLLSLYENTCTEIESLKDWDKNFSLECISLPIVMSVLKDWEIKRRSHVDVLKSKEKL